MKKNNMEFFNKQIDGIDFSFKKVFYGGELKYHLAYKDTEDNKNYEFIMYKDEEGMWKIAAQLLPDKIFDLQMEFNDAIDENIDEI